VDSALNIVTNFFYGVCRLRIIAKYFTGLILLVWYASIKGRIKVSMGGYCGLEGFIAL
jgi:hypothetical protein